MDKPGMGNMAVRQAIVTFLLSVVLVSACSSPAERETTREPLGVNTRQNNASVNTRSLAAVSQATGTASTIPPDRTANGAVLRSSTSTPTPPLTSTVLPLSTSSIGPIPGVQQAVAGKLPLISHDLLFMTDSTLKVWRSETGQVDMLAQSVLDYDVASDGEKVLILQSLGSTRNALELVLINMDSGQEQLLVTVQGELVDFALSPDSRRVAYVIGEDDPQGSEVRPAEPIYVLEAASDTAPVIVATCDTAINIGDRRFHYYLPCGPLVWTPDSQSILWGDGAGVWQTTPSNSPVILVHNELYEDDPPRLFRPTIDWSPDGRYQLLVASRAEGSNRHVYDTETQQLIEVPNSTSGLGDFTHWIWADDKRLFTVRGPEPSDGEIDAVAEKWQISAQTLALETSIFLPGSGVAVPAAPAQFQNGQFGFVLNGHELPAEAYGLYILGSFREKARLVNTFPQLPGISPPHGQNIVWAPDGSGAIVSQVDPGTGAALFILYASADDGKLYELQPALGQHPHSFDWLP
jgi:hypothetical protein